MNKQLTFSFHRQPGLYWSRSVLDEQVGEMRDVAKTCLSELPMYQCLSGDRKTLSRNLIVQARDKKTNELVAFCSGILFNLNDKENVLHLGLTCVKPDYRGLKLTHKLTSRMIKGYFMEFSIFKPVWISNLACVLSSLGNVAKYFEQVYPSPFMSYPKKKHMEIAKMINSTYRHDMFIPKEVKFNPVSFVFEGSVKGNQFEKSESDSQYFHRDLFINNFYQRAIDFNRGDEVLQIGKVSILTFIKYAIKRMFYTSINIGDFFESEKVTGEISRV